MLHNTVRQTVSTLARTASKRALTTTSSRLIHCTSSPAVATITTKISNSVLFSSQKSNTLKHFSTLSTKTTLLASAATATVTATKSNTNTHTHTVKSVIPINAQSLKVVFSDNSTSDYHYIWLRDNCHCPACRHPVTKQKLLDTPSLPLDIKPTSLQVNPSTGNIEITWSHENHSSVFEPNWLRQYSYSSPTTPAPSVAIPSSRLTLWDRATIESNLPVMEYAELANDDKGVLKWLTLLERFGVAVVRGTPVEKDQVMAMARRIAHVKETSYGSSFDVLNEPRPGAHLAFTGVELKHHTDMNYMEKSPGIQLLHCLRAEATGGESVFVDGFYIAEWLKASNPSAYHVLSSTDVGFAIRNGDFSYINHLPIICLDRNGSLLEVHVNNRTMQPMITHPDVIVPFYAGFKQINDKMRERSSELRLDMRPGDVVAFNNRRVLHGRTAFDPSSGVRHLQGCYVDMEEFSSRVRYLREKHGDVF